MSALSRSAKDAKVNEFIEITGATSAEATRFLKGAGWRMEAAVDAFYSDPSACRAAEVRAQQASVGTSRKNLEKLWEKYKDPANPLESDFEGTVRFCEDLGVEPSDVIVLALAWLLTAPSMPRFAKVGYVDGWLRLGKDTASQQRAYLPRLRADLQDPTLFRKIYVYAFDYAKTEGQKSLQLEVASELWNLLIPLDPEPHLSTERLAHWQAFLASRGSKAVSKDTWTLFLDFSRTINDDLSNHDEDAAWPSLIDEFVEKMRTGA